MKAYDKHQVDGVEHKQCTDCGSGVAVTGTWGQPSAMCKNKECASVKYFCMQCLEVVTVEVHEHFKSMSKCALCGYTNCVPHSLAEVASKYPGYLACEIIDARSHLNTNKEGPIPPKETIEHVRNDATDSAGTSDGGHDSRPVEQQQVAVGGQQC